MDMNKPWFPTVNSLWVEPRIERDKPYYRYTVIGVTSGSGGPHYPQYVVYRGDNGHLWVKPLRSWPGSLRPKER